MFERVAKLVKTDRTRTWKLDQAARSILLTEFVSAFFLAMRYFFKPKATLNYPFEKGSLSPLSRRACAAHCLAGNGEAVPAQSLKGQGRLIR